MNGAGQVATVDGPLRNDTIAYSYDEFGRLIQRAINGAANTVTWAFDALGRVTSEEKLLGNLPIPTKGDVSSREVTYPNGQTSVYSYLTDDRRPPAPDNPSQVPKREHVVEVRLYVRCGGEHPDVAAAG